MVRIHESYTYDYIHGNNIVVASYGDVGMDNGEDSDNDDGSHGDDDTMVVMIMTLMI